MAKVMSRHSNKVVDFYFLFIFIHICFCPHETADFVYDMDNCFSREM